MSRLGKILFACSAISFLSMLAIRWILGGWVPFCWVALGFFVAFLVGGSYVDRKILGEFFGMKTTKQGFSMGTMILLVVTLLSAVNFLGARKYKSWDLSADKVNSLSEQSIKLIKDLKEDLKVVYFYRDGADNVDDNRRRFIELIRKYQDQSPLVKLEFVEVNQNPALAEKYNIKKGTQAVVLDYKGKTNMIEKIDEQEITSALVKVTREKAKSVYILGGHGELPLERQADGSGISFMKEVLEGNHYTVKTLNFATTPEIPADADIVVIPGPMQQMIQIEIIAIENYLKKGGSVFVALEPKGQHGLDPLLQTLGLKLSNTVLTTALELQGRLLMDPSLQTRGSQFSAADSITKPFPKGEVMVFMVPTVIERIGASPPAGITIEDLVKTGQDAMEFENNQFDKPGKRGPFTVVSSVKGKFPGAPAESKEFSLVLAADRDFLTDKFLYRNLNRDLVLNSMAALAKDENLISITPKEVSKTKMEVTATQFKLFILLFIIPLPIVLFVTSGVLWVRRRYS